MSKATTTRDEALYKLPAKSLRALKQDPVRSAQAIDLRYVNDGMKGIARQKHGANFRYRSNDAPVTDAEILGRIKSLAIPPAWTDVWICPHANGHLQATGKDARGRKQYRYHLQWSRVRSHTKFHHALEFGNRIPDIRERLAKDLNRSNLDREKVLALVVSIMDQTHIRIGNASYEKDNNSFGLSTLKDKHVKSDPRSVRLIFKGKTGIAHDVKIQSRKLARLVTHCRDLPGQELFQYIDANGEPKPIDSGMVNDYIREISGGPFTSKDFRTWKGTVHCLKGLIAETCPTSATARKEAINKALDEAAKQLGNTRAVCRKYYIHPEVITSFECEKLHRLMDSVHGEDVSTKGGYTFEERLVLKVLQAARRTR
ncbi:MAG: DNA topoisomerase IB [Bacteroidota bacterium]|nr:DNA topoisomerase IB [Bacteroidota bacterium]